MSAPRLSAITIIAALFLFLNCGVLSAQTPEGPTSEPQLATVDGVEEPVYHDLFKPGLKAPLPIRHPEPKYTEEAAQNRVSGFVLLMIVVTAKGDVKNIKVVNGLGSGLDEEAVKTLQKWKFKPGTKDGVPVYTTVAIQVEFHL